ncbi:hypothetical protein AOCH_002677 [Aspergillus ochraceoroseus]|uniref:Zn(2)-C6 fungal-type domain-containing protein n=1 Tax=Aspergillus ochraceoroseus TaxID=138278 RepID=A0A0F8W2M8_9EURO|nr:hypothetical protein AOCH_002677 [Aspergillus ochraceoroseus]
MNVSESSAPQTRASSPSRDYNPRKRGRTACTRCKTRKQKCDNDYPVCSNCLKAGAECDKASVRQENGSPNEYTRALEERIAYLESQLQSRAMRPGQSNGQASHPVTAILSPQNQEIGQKGSAAGNSSAMPSHRHMSGRVRGSHWPPTLGRWFKQRYGIRSYLRHATSLLSLVAEEGTLRHPGDPGQLVSLHSHYRQIKLLGTDDGPRTLRMDELLAKSTEPPNDELGARILHVYLTRLHVRYPFLDRKELWRLHEGRWRLAKTKREELTPVERFGIFKLYLAYAIGATTMQLSEKYNYRFYITALQQVPGMCETRSVENVEAMTLLVIYHLRSASSQGVWYMIGLAIRTAIDLGLHRKANENNLDPITAQMRRRLFSGHISDRDIDLPLPIDVDDDVRDPGLLPPDSSSPNNKRITTLTPSATLPPLQNGPSLPRTRREWKAAALERFSGSDLDYPILHYNRAVRLLIQPFLPSLPLTDPYYHICLRAAGDVCQAHKRLHQTLEYGHSFLTVQTVFMAGITLLYALWTHTDRVWSVQMSNDIRACSTVLFVMGERAAWVKKYRDAFEHLVNAAMEKLEGSEAAKTAGMAELMAAQQHSNAGFAVGTGPGPCADPHATTTTTTGVTGTPDLTQGFGRAASAGTATGTGIDPTSQDHGVRMALQLAPWIDLEDGPFWMPDFETLEGFSGNLWSGEGVGDPGPFDSL